MKDHSHEQVREALGAYALDALDPVEKTEIARHLSGCKTCRDEVSMHQEAIAALVGEASPPASVWEGVLAKLEEEPPPLSLVTSVLPKRGRRWITSALAVAAVFVGLLSYRVADQTDEIDRLAAANRDVSLLRLAAAASADPSAERVLLISADETTSVNAVMLADGTGFLVKDNLRSLPPGRTYQLWALVGDAKISLGVLGGDPDVLAFKMVADAKGLAITDEIAGGVAVTASPPVVVGFISA